MRAALLILVLVTVASTAEGSPGLADVSDPLATTSEWGGGIRLTGLSGIGALPERNFGVEVAGLVRHDEAFVELGLGRWTPEHDYVVAETQTPLALDVWSLRVGWASIRMPLRAWVLAETGEIAGVSEMPNVVSRMLMGTAPSDRSWSQVGAGVGVAWPMTKQARVVGNLELGVPLHRETVMLNDGPYTPDPLTARFSIGLEVGWR